MAKPKLADLKRYLGGMPDSSYNAAGNAFEKALKLISQHKLESYFQMSCQELAYTRKENFDYYFKESLQDLYE